MTLMGPAGVSTSPEHTYESRQSVDATTVVSASARRYLHNFYSRYLVSISIQNNRKITLYDAYGTREACRRLRAYVWAPAIGGRDDCGHHESPRHLFNFMVFGVNFYSNYYSTRIWYDARVGVSQIRTATRFATQSSESASPTSPSMAYDFEWVIW